MSEALAVRPQNGLHDRSLTTDGLPALNAHRLFLAARFLGTRATGSRAIVLAWEVYETAHQSMTVAEASFALGMIGLAQFLPLFALTPLAGKTADRHNRRSLAVCFDVPIVIALGQAIKLVANVFGFTAQAPGTDPAAKLPLKAVLKVTPVDNTNHAEGDSGRGGRGGRSSVQVEVTVE